MNSPQSQVEEIHLADYLNVIWRRKMIFLLSFLSLFAGVALFTYMMKPVFEASATLHIKDDKGSKGGILGELAMLSSPNPVAAEIEILKSRTNAEEVVRRLHLNWVITRKNGGNATIAEFSSSSATPSYTIELAGANTFKVIPDDGSPKISGTTGQLIKTPTLNLLISGLQGKAGDSIRLQQGSFNTTADSLRKSIRVSESGKNTNIIKVSYSSNNPFTARDVVNATIQAYLARTISFKTEEASRTVAFVEEQLKGTRDELDRSEINLQTFKSSSGVVKLDTETDELVRKLSEVEKERVAVIMDRTMIEFALAAQQEARRKGQVYSPSGFKDDPQIMAMANRLTEMEVQRRALVSENTEKHPQVKVIQGQIDQVQKNLKSAFETSRINLNKKETLIQKQIADYEAKLRKLPAAERDLARLLRFSKVNADIYMFLLQKHEEARIAKAATVSNINVVDEAIAPNKPVKPQKRKNLMLGLLVGLMFGVCAAFFIEYLDDTIKDEEEAKRALDWPLLAMIPAIEVPDDPAQAAARDARLVVMHKPKSSVSEAFRGLRTAIHFSSLKRENKTIMITSSFPGEGKTTIVANLALTFAHAGNRVIMVDCDLRRPALNKIFGHPRSPGITEFLAGDATLADVLYETEIHNVSLLTAGMNPPNPAELLCSDGMKSLLNGLRESYDIIIIDAPPVIPVTDAPLLSAFADMVVVVVESGRIPAKAAQRMKELLQAVHAPVSGFILNDRNALYSARYGYYGKGYYGKGYYGRHYYGYSYYGADDQDTAKSKRPWWKKFLK